MYTEYSRKIALNSYQKRVIFQSDSSRNPHGKQAKNLNQQEFLSRNIVFLPGRCKLAGIIWQENKIPTRKPGRNFSKFHPEKNIFWQESKNIQNVSVYSKIHNWVNDKFESQQQRTKEIHGINSFLNKQTFEMFKETACNICKLQKVLYIKYMQI